MMELAPHGNLKEYLLAERIAMDRRLAGWIMRQTLNGLSHLHALNILHADIKPENLLVFAGACPLIKIGDLGSAVDLKSKTVTSCISTTHYAAPEMLEVEYDKSSRVTTAADIYSAGVLFAELVGMTHPFHPFDEPQAMPHAERFQYIRKNRPPVVEVKGQAMALTKHATDFLLHSTAVDAAHRSPAYILRSHPITWGSSRGVPPKKWVHPDGQNAANRVAAYDANIRNGKEKVALREQIEQLNLEVEKGKKVEQANRERNADLLAEIMSLQGLLQVCIPSTLSNIFIRWFF